MVGDDGMGRSIESGSFDVNSISGVGWLLLSLATVGFLYLSVRLLLLVPVVAMENLGPIASIRRVFALTSGHFWRLLGFLLILMVGFFIVALTVGAVIGALVTLVAGRPEPWSISLLLVALTGGLVQAGFFMPPPLTSEGQVTYAPGNPKPTVDQMARDVAAFLMWTAEPNLQGRHKSGFAVLAFLIVATILAYLSY